MTEREYMTAAEVVKRAVAEHAAAIAHLPWDTDHDGAVRAMYEESAERFRIEGPVIFDLPPERFVYFFQSAEGGAVKIGSTRNVQRRLREVQTGHQAELRILGVCRGGTRFERELHDRFDAYRLHGEWFAPTRELLRLIKAVRR
jgi:hypothetical protein